MILKMGKLLGVGQFEECSYNSHYYHYYSALYMAKKMKFEQYDT